MRELHIALGVNGRPPIAVGAVQAENTSKLKREVAYLLMWFAVRLWLVAVFGARTKRMRLW